MAVFLLIFYDKPTCFDGKQNQDESGVDCGGVCEKVCSFQAVKPNIIWSRSFKVSEGIYNAIAYIENPNIRAEAFAVPYVFKIFDERNILISEKKARMIEGRIINKRLGERVVKLIKQKTRHRRVL